jgi:hypothetical protein
MALADMQAALARLFTEAEARADFARDAKAAARGWGLDKTEADRLASLAPGAVDRFAGSLRAKRALDAGKLLPTTALALGPDFARKLRAHLAGPPRGAAGDALALVAELQAAPDFERPWIGDLARYEGGFIEARDKPFGLWLRAFRFPVVAIALGLLRGEVAPNPTLRRGWALWARAPGGRLVHRTWRLG